MSQPAGWYDDPQESDLLRYWDGTQWTAHTSPRHRPQPRGEASGASSGYSSGGEYPQQSAGSAYGGGSNYGAGSAYGGYGYQPMPGGEESARGGRPTTPDGQAVSGWWRRFFARVVDGLLVQLVVLAMLPVVAPDFVSTFEQWLSAISDPATLDAADVTSQQEQMIAQAGRLGLFGAVLSLIYETVFLKVAAATPGKLLLGLRVRLRERPGPLEWNTCIVRALMWDGPSLLGVVPVLGNIAGLVPLVNGLWPLWDSANQSLNDKLAKTNVVRRKG